MSISKATELLELATKQQEMLTHVLVVAKEFEDYADSNIFKSILSQKHELGVAATHITLAEIANSLQDGAFPVRMREEEGQIFTFNPDELDDLMDEELDDEDDDEDDEDDRGYPTNG
jgi:hypothetical protein